MRKKNIRRKRIAFGGQKGGCGKTTFVASLAEWLLEHGYPFRLLDGNPGQQSLLRWTKIRSNNAIVPSLEATTAFEVTEERTGRRLRDRTAEQLQAAFDGVTLLDLPGVIDDGITPALLNCDAFVIPMPPKAYDYLSLTEVGALLNAAQAMRSEEGLRPLELYLVLNLVRRSKAMDELRPRIYAEAPRFGLKVCKTELSDTNDHFTAQLLGRSALSYAPSSKAAEQIDALARELGL